MIKVSDYGHALADYPSKNLIPFVPVVEGFPVRSVRVEEFSYLLGIHDLISEFYNT
jgi:hypothetical protein